MLRMCTKSVLTGKVAFRMCSSNGSKCWCCQIHPHLIVFHPFNRYCWLKPSKFETHCMQNFWNLCQCKMCKCAKKAKTIFGKIFNSITLQSLTDSLKMKLGIKSLKREIEKLKVVKMLHERCSARFKHQRLKGCCIHSITSSDWIIRNMFLACQHLHTRHSLALRVVQ